jgi:hypothetical protein
VCEGDADADVVVTALRTRVAEVGRIRVVEHLTLAIANLESQLGDVPGLHDLKHWATELGQYDG